MSSKSRKTLFADAPALTHVAHAHVTPLLHGVPGPPRIEKHTLMSSPRDDPEVLHLPAEHRFVIPHHDGEAELVYQLDGDTMVIVHTEVPAALGGRGVGGRLVNAALGWAAAKGLTVVPWCPFVRQYLRRHPDEAAVVTVDWSTPPPTHPPAGEPVAGRARHVEEHLDEQEEESLPASDPHSDWAGPG